MSVKVIVCRVGQEPKVEEVQNPFSFTKQSLINGGYVEEQPLLLSSARILGLWEEVIDASRLPFNRSVPARSPIIPEVDFVIDRRDPRRSHAKPGELGYFEVRGNFLITKANNDGDYVSLTDVEINALLPFLELVGKCAQCKTNPVAYPGAKYCGAACSAEAEMHK